MLLLRLIRLLPAGLLCCPQAVMAGLPPQAAKIAMIREAVNFYSCDTALSQQPVVCGAADMTGLSQCAAAMKGVGRKIREWDIEINGQEQLKWLGEKIKAEVIQGKMHRKSLPQYRPFIRAVDSIVQAAGGPAEGPAKRQAAPAAATAPQETIKPIVPGTYGSAPASPPRPLAAPDLWTIIALALAASGLIVSLATYRRQQIRQRKRKGELQRSAAESPDLSLQLRRLEETVLVLKDRITEIGRSRPLSPEPFLPPIAPVPADPEPAAVRNPVRRWAKNADNGGFDIDQLGKEPDDKKIFELLIQDEHNASFTISGNREAQLFALSSPNTYLRNACTYSTSPGHESRIESERPGRLRRRGNQWEIIELLQIRFS